MTEGTIENREPIPGRPGEDRGTLIKNGRGLKVKAGDVINMPPNTPHQSIPDPKGFSYMLIKVNIGAVSVGAHREVRQEGREGQEEAGTGDSVGDALQGVPTNR